MFYSQSCFWFGLTIAEYPPPPADTLLSQCWVNAGPPSQTYLIMKVILNRKRKMRRSEYIHLHEIWLSDFTLRICTSSSCFITAYLLWLYLQNVAPALAQYWFDFGATCDCRNRPQSPLTSCSTWCWANDSLMMVHRLRRWPNISRHWPNVTYLSLRCRHTWLCHPFVPLTQSNSCVCRSAKAKGSICLLVK